MSNSWAVRLTLLFLTFPFSLHAQSTQTRVVSAPSRDAQAISILSGILAKAGGEATIAAIQDFTASGTITYNWAPAPVSGSATVRGRGQVQFRLDATLPNGSLSYVVDTDGGFFKDVTGAISDIPLHNTVNVGVLSFPYTRVLAALNDPTTSVSYVGLAQLADGAAQQVRLQRRFPESQDPRGILSELTITDLFVNIQSGLIEKISDMTHPLDNLTRAIAHDLEFGSYQTVAGIEVPMAITEKILGQVIWSLEIGNMAFNTGLTDTTF